MERAYEEEVREAGEKKSIYGHYGELAGRGHPQQHPVSQAACRMKPRIPDLFQ